MPDIVVRPLEDRDLDGFDTVRSLTYNNGDPIPLERREMKTPGVQSYVAELDGSIVGGCQVLDLTVNRGDAVMKCGGVAGVAVLPELRKSGVGSAMMSWLINHLGETGTPVAALYAFREPFYRKFGYEVAGRRLKIVCPTNRWPKVDTPLPIRRLTPSDWQELAPCYAAFAAQRSGLNIRNDWQWKRVLGENRQLTIYAVGNPVEAYAVVSHVTAFWTTDHISEIVWSTRRGYEGILAMLGGLAINKNGLSWFEPSDGPFDTDFLDQGITVTVDRPTMFRINDVEKALGHLRPEMSLSGEFRVLIRDELIVKNRGPWRVVIEDGEVSVEKQSCDDNWDFSLDIRNFVQAFLGEPGIQQLARSGNISVRNLHALSIAERLLPSQSTYCMDFF